MADYPTYPLGHVCEHGRLARSCDDCFHAWELSQLRSELERVKGERDAENLRAKQALSLVGELRTEVERLAFSCMEREGQRDAAESKLTASESARRVLVEEVRAWRTEFTHEGVMDDKIGLAMLATNSLKLLEGEG